MFIFIRHGEKSKKDNINLSEIGFIRRNNLPEFFTKKKNINIKIPQRIIVMKQHHPDTSNRPLQTVSVLADVLKINIENDYKSSQISEVINSFYNTNKTVLICWEHIDLALIVESYINKVFNKNIKLHWGKNPLASYDSNTDYTSIWIIDDNKLKVYNLFDVIYDSRYDYYNIDYSKVTSEPIFVLELSEPGIYYKIKSYFFNVNGL